MGKEPTCTKSKCSKSLGALLDDLDRLVVVAGAHLAHRSDFERAKWRQLFVGSASYVELCYIVRVDLFDPPEYE